MSGMAVHSPLSAVTIEGTRKRPAAIVVTTPAGTAQYA